MAFQPVANTYELALKWTTVGGIEVVNVLHWLLYTYFSPSQAVADAVMGLIDTAFDDGGLYGALPTTTEFSKLVVTGLDHEGDLQFESTAATNAGTSTANPLADMVSMVASARTGLRSRSGRGRTYFPPPSEEFASGNSPSTDAINAVNASCTNLLDTFNTSTGALIIVSRYSGKDPDTGKPVKRDIVLKNPVVSWTCDPYFGTQRRRRPR